MALVSGRGQMRAVSDCIESHQRQADSMLTWGRTMPPGLGETRKWSADCLGRSLEGEMAAVFYPRVVSSWGEHGERCTAFC